MKQRKPIVIEPLGMYPPRARNQVAQKIYNATLTKWMTNRASAVVATSEAEAVDLRQIADPNKIVFRRNGIDVSNFASLPSGKYLRSRWQVRDEEKLILFVGRLSPIKNLEQMIAAFAAIKVASNKFKVEGDSPKSPLSHLPAFPPSHASATLVLVGPSEPEYEQKLRNLVTRERLTDAVIFAGPLYGDEQKAALAAADLFVLPSLNESFGNAAGEAVAADVPVLLTNTCGIAPLIHERAGLAVPLGEESIANGIRQMLDEARSRELTARREEVKRELSWDEPIAQTEALYERLIKETQR